MTHKHTRIHYPLTSHHHMYTQTASNHQEWTVAVQLCMHGPRVSQAFIDGAHHSHTNIHSVRVFLHIHVYIVMDAWKIVHMLSKCVRMHTCVCVCVCVCRTMCAQRVAHSSFPSFSLSPTFHFRSYGERNVWALGEPPPLLSFSLSLYHSHTCTRLWIVSTLPHPHNTVGN